MEINVSDVSTSIRAADASTLLTPQILERIVAIVVQRVFEEQQRQDRIKAERSLETSSNDRD
jgi:hypothetical protein